MKVKMIEMVSFEDEVYQKDGLYNLNIRIIEVHGDSVETLDEVEDQAKDEEESKK